MSERQSVPGLGWKSAKCLQDEELTLAPSERQTWAWRQGSPAGGINSFSPSVYAEDLASAR